MTKDYPLPFKIVTELSLLENIHDNKQFHWFLSGLFKY